MNPEKIEKRHVAILIPYYFEGKEMHVFMQKRGKNARRLPGYFGFFGGGLEKDELAEMALKREIKEELGIDIQNYLYFNHYEFYGSILDVYVMEVDKDFSKRVVIGEGEFGKFLKEGDIVNEEKIIESDKLILGNLFGELKRGNPFDTTFGKGV